MGLCIKPLNFWRQKISVGNVHSLVHIEFARQELEFNRITVSGRAGVTRGEVLTLISECKWPSYSCIGLLNDRIFLLLNDLVIQGHPIEMIPLCLEIRRHIDIDLHNETSSPYIRSTQSWRATMMGQLLPLVQLWLSSEVSVQYLAGTHFYGSLCYVIWASEKATDLTKSTPLIWQTAPKTSNNIKLERDLAVQGCREASHYHGTGLI